MRETFARTDRLLLQSWQPDDVDAIFALHADPRVQANYPSDPEKWTRDAMAARIEGYIADQRALGFTKWRVALHDGTFVGRAGWSPWEADSVELGYAFAPPFWGRGYAGEAAQAAVDWAVAHIARGRRVGFAMTHNAASRRVLQKVGMRFVDLRPISGAEHAFYELQATPSRSNSPQT